MFREEATSDFSSWFSVLVELDFGVFDFWEPREKPSEQGVNQQQTQLTYATGLELNTGHIGGRRALSPPCQPC